MSEALIKYIKRKRKELGLKQEDLAKALKMTVTSYSKIELGTTKMTDEKLQVIADVMNMTPHEMKLAAAKDSKVLNGLGDSPVPLRDHLLLIDKYTKVQEQLIAALLKIEKLKKRE